MMKVIDKSASSLADLIENILNFVIDAKSQLVSQTYTALREE